MELYATYYGWDSVEKYLQSIYGVSANQKTYLEYSRITRIASAYAQHYYSGLQFTAQDYRDYENQENRRLNYNSYSYTSYFVSVEQYLEFLNPDNSLGVYTEEERSSACQAAKAAANLLANTATTVDALNLAIGQLDLNQNNPDAAATESRYVQYGNIGNSLICNWVADTARIPGETAVLEVTDNSVISGYYVVLFEGCDENRLPLANVQHILVLAETEEEKHDAIEKANAILTEFLTGKKQDSAAFGELTAKYSDDTGSKNNGGLIENICRNNTYVKNFEDWALAGHEPGDTGIIETEYGYHVMFYKEDGALTYRDYLIHTDLANDTYTAWTDSILENVTVTEVDLTCLDRNFVVGS